MIEFWKSSSDVENDFSPDSEPKNIRMGTYDDEEMLTQKDSNKSPEASFEYRDSYENSIAVVIFKQQDSNESTEASFAYGNLDEDSVQQSAVLLALLQASYLSLLSCFIFFHFICCFFLLLNLY